MLTDAEKQALAARLRRVEGQIAGVGRMVERGDYCVDVLLQVAAARAALGRVGRLVLESHVKSCVCDAMTSGDDADREKKISELLDVFEHYADLKRR